MPSPFLAALRYVYFRFHWMSSYLSTMARNYHTKSAYTESDSTAVARIRHRNDHRGGRIGPGAEFDIYAVIKVDRRIRWHYTTTIPRLRIGARLTKYRNCKFHNFARTISRHADGISRYSVPPSAGPLLLLHLRLACLTIATMA